MLTAKPWRTEALARLLISVLVSVLLGSLIVATFNPHGTNVKPAYRFLVFGAAFLSLVAALVLLRKPWTFENIPRRLAAVVGCGYAGMLFAAWAQKLSGPSGPSVSQMVVGGLSFQGAALVLTPLFLREHGVGWSEAFGFKDRWQRALLTGLLLACLFLPIGWTVQLGSAKLIEWAGQTLPGWHLKPEAQQAVQTLQLTMTWVNRLALALITIALAPAAEEILFRGILYPWIKQAGFPRLALWGNALLFATMHMNLVAFVPLTLLALALTLVYERTGNLLAPICAHAVFNALNFTLLYFQEQLTRFR